MNNKFTTILIGNGLGMAISPSTFTIDSGLKAAWKKINKETQGRIKSQMESGDLDNEKQLDKHYPAIHACQMLNKLENTSNYLWLDKTARDFPRNFSLYIENVAKHFFDFIPTISELDKDTAFDTFANILSEYILANNIHLVTLNYDKLLYSKFITNPKIMRGKEGKLLDGFYVDTLGFTPEVLEQKKAHQGFYLHLHGSPLFYTDITTNKVDKSRIVRDGGYESKDNLIREHLILCNTKHKLWQITSSSILSFYWSYFNVALQQSEKIILYGYSGEDTHINEAIEKYKNIEIIIVEYADNSLTLNDRKLHWAKKLKKPVSYFDQQHLISLKSILEHVF